MGSPGVWVPPPLLTPGLSGFSQVNPGARVGPGAGEGGRAGKRRTVSGRTRYARGLGWTFSANPQQVSGARRATVHHDALARVGAHCVRPATRRTEPFSGKPQGVSGAPDESMHSDAPAGAHERALCRAADLMHGSRSAVSQENHRVYRGPRGLSADCMGVRVSDGRFPQSSLTTPMDHDYRGGLVSRSVATRVRTN